MRRLLVGLGLGLLACSGGRGGGAPVLDQDYASSFTGTWNGPFTISANGVSDTTTIVLPIDSSAANRLSLGGFCPDRSAVTAVVTGSASFRLDARACPPMATLGCEAVTVTFDRGSGELDSGSLTLETSGTMSGCGIGFEFKARLVGTRSAVLLAAGESPSWAEAAVAAIEGGAR